MPTGYTNIIQDDATFPQFLWRCARAFGAMVMMRDDDIDAVPPERFEPDGWHLQESAKAEAALKNMDAMTAAEAEQECLRKHQERVEYNRRILGEHRELRAKYQAILAQVRDWQPPTKDHEGLKEFMVKQLQDSIDFDCNDDYYAEPVLLTVNQWRADRSRELLRNIAYHQKGYAEEVERTESRNRWLAELRQSVPYESSQKKVAKDVPRCGS